MKVCIIATVIAIGAYLPAAVSAFKPIDGIVSDHIVACYSEKDFDRMVERTQKDIKTPFEFVTSGKCTYVSKGTSVIIEGYNNNTDYAKSKIKMRIKGESRSVWTWGKNVDK